MDINDSNGGYVKSIRIKKNTPEIVEGEEIGYIEQIITGVDPGKGFYDNYLCNHPEIVKIGLAYECQKVGSIDAAENDICCDYIITEENIYERD